MLELLGLGSTWSGLYYVTGATHLLHRSSGYSTQFEVRRNGTGYSNENVVIDDPEPPAAQEDDSAGMSARVSRGGSDS